MHSPAPRWEGVPVGDHPRGDEEKAFLPRGRAQHPVVADEAEPPPVRDADDGAPKCEQTIQQPGMGRGGGTWRGNRWRNRLGNHWIIF